MPNVFLVSDTHFGHKNICKFIGPDGVTPLRPWDDVDEMDEALVKNWNEVVRPSDKVYHLGDVAINKKHLSTVGRLNGDKVLVKGNHDRFKLEEYTPYFSDIKGCHEMKGMVLTHVPIHPDGLNRFPVNVHGHLHAYRVKMHYEEIDYRYFNVSVEQINYRPISLDELRKRIAEQRELFMSNFEGYGNHVVVD